MLYLYGEDSHGDAGMSPPLRQRKNEVTKDAKTGTPTPRMDRGYGCADAVDPRAGLLGHAGVGIETDRGGQAARCTRREVVMTEILDLTGKGPSRPQQKKSNKGFYVVLLVIALVLLGAVIAKAQT